MIDAATVGFVYNFPCPLHCSFCCHTKDVVGPGRLCPDNVTPLVLSFSKEPSVVRFAFTGGDPFVYIDEIMQIMRDARTAGVTQPFHIVTSGYWADSNDYTNKVLTELVSLGMDVLFVSYDREHSRWVSPEQVHRIAEVCAQLFLKLHIYGIFWDQNDKVEDLLPELVGIVPMGSDVALSIGAAKQHYGQGPRYDVEETAKYRCTKPRHYDLTIYPNGDVFPCCSGGFNKEAKLDCGNVFSNSAAQVLERVYSLFHARVAKEIGFDQLYKRVESTRPDLLPLLPSFASVDSVCEICRDIHSNTDLMTQLKQVYEEMEVDYALKRVSVHEARGMFVG